MARSKRTGGKPAGQRQLRVGEELRHALAQLFARDEIQDPGVAGVSITVTEVRVSSDLKHAVAYILPLAGTNSDTVMAGLERSARFVRGRVAHMVRLKFAPSISFALDDRFDYAARVDALLQDPRVAADLADAGDEDQNGS